MAILDIHQVSLSLQTRQNILALRAQRRWKIDLTQRVNGHA